MSKHDYLNKQNESNLQKTLKLLRQKHSKGFSSNADAERDDENTAVSEVMVTDEQELSKETSGESAPVGTTEATPNQNEEEGVLCEATCAPTDLKEEIISGILNPSENQSEEEKTPVNASVEVTVSKDKMTAYIVVVSPSNGGEDITAEQIHAQLEQLNVCYGVDEDEINRLVETKYYNHQITIAKGVEPVHGEDGKVLELKLRDTKQKVHTREDGTIDFKNLGAVNTIKEGERILRIIPPTEGIDGATVHGAVIRGKHGKKAKVEKGENTLISEDGEYLIAACDGDLKYTRNGFSVSKVFVVDGNLDNTVGNIEFIGDVEIAGVVMEGFSVTAKGNVNIGGMVEGASITAGGNITIRNGINGMGSGQLYAGGEVRCKFIENCTVIAKGDIYAESVINSSVSSHGALYVAGRKGAIIGGKITIQNTIEAKTVGSQFNVPTDITLGAPPEMLEKRAKLTDELNEVRTRISKIEKDIQYLETVEENRGLTDARKKQLSQLRFSEPLEKLRAQRVEKVIQEINDIINSADKCKLSCTTIYPAVKVSIRDSVYISKVQESKCTFMYVDGEIRRFQG